MVKNSYVTQDSLLRGTLFQKGRSAKAEFETRNSLGKAKANFDIPVSFRATQLMEIQAV